MEEPPRGNTEIELSNFLEAALAAAESMVRESISAKDWVIAAAVAENLLGSRVSVAKEVAGKEVSQRKAEIFDYDHELVARIADSLPDDPAAWPAPVRLTVKLGLMERAIDRSEVALVRYADF